MSATDEVAIDQRHVSGRRDITDKLRDAWEPEYILAEHDHRAPDLEAHVGQGKSTSAFMDRLLQAESNNKCIYCLGSCFSHLSHLLLQPGPSFCIAGSIKLQAQNAGDKCGPQKLRVIFYLPEGRSHQQLYYDPATRTYISLPRALALPMEEFRIAFEIDEVAAFLKESVTVLTTCLN